MDLGGHSAGAVPYLACTMPTGVHASPKPFAYLGYHTTRAQACSALLHSAPNAYTLQGDTELVDTYQRPIVVLGGEDVPALLLCLKLEVPFVFTGQAPAAGQAELLYPYSMRLGGTLIVALRLPEPEGRLIWWVDGALVPDVEARIRSLL